jgi:hypothetical protein
MILKVRASARLKPPAIPGRRASVSSCRGDRSAALELPCPEWAPQPDIKVELLEGVDTLLKPLGDGEVSRFYRDPVIALAVCWAMSNRSATFRSSFAGEERFPPYRIHHSMLVRYGWDSCIRHH